MAQTASCLLAAIVAGLACFGVGQVGLWTLRVPTRSAVENVVTAAGLGTAVWCLGLSALGPWGGLSPAVADLLTLGWAAVGVWGAAVCWLRARLAPAASTPWPEAERRWPAAGGAIVTLGMLATAAALIAAAAPPLPGNPFSAEIVKSSRWLHGSADPGWPPVSTLALVGPLVMGGVGAGGPFRWALAALAASLAALALEVPPRQAQVRRPAARWIAALLSASAPISTSTEQTAGGLLVGGWLTLTWLALRRATCDPAGRRWQMLAAVTGAAAACSAWPAVGTRSDSDVQPALTMLTALGPLLACAAPVALLTSGWKRSSAAAAGMIVLLAGWALGDGLAAAAWAAPLLATGAAQAVTALDSFPLRVRRCATAALAAGLAAQAASPLVAARGAWGIVLGSEPREQYLEQRVASFRAARLLGDLVRQWHVVVSDEPELLYYQGPPPLRVLDEGWSAAVPETPVYLLAIDPPPPDSPVERWLAARGLTLEAEELACLMDYRVEDPQTPRRYRLLRMAPGAARGLPEAAGSAAAQTANRPAATDGRVRR